MPVRPLLQIKHTESIIPLEIINPGASISVPNFAHEEGEVLIVKSPEDDLGGELYTLPWGYFKKFNNEDSQGIIVPDVCLNEETLVAEFYFGGGHTEEIVDRRGTHAYLILQHIGQAAMYLN